MLEECSAVLLIKVEDDLGIALCSETIPLSYERRSDLLEIVNLPIAHEDEAAVVAFERLSPCFEVDHLETRMSKCDRHRRLGKRTAAVGSPVAEDVEDLLDACRGQRPTHNCGRFPHISRQAPDQGSGDLGLAEIIGNRDAGRLGLFHLRWGNFIESRRSGNPERFSGKRPLQGAGDALSRRRICHGVLASRGQCRTYRLPDRRIAGRGPPAARHAFQWPHRHPARNFRLDLLRISAKRQRGSRASRRNPDCSDTGAAGRGLVYAP